MIKSYTTLSALCNDFFLIFYIPVNLRIRRTTRKDSCGSDGKRRNKPCECCSNSKTYNLNKDINVLTLNYTKLFFCVFYRLFFRIRHFNRLKHSFYRLKINISIFLLKT